MEIEASVPGFRPEDVTITLDNGVLTIAAERTETTGSQERKYIRKERQTGRLYRQVVLGEV